MPPYKEKHTNMENTQKNLESFGEDTDSLLCTTTRARDKSHTKIDTSTTPHRNIREVDGASVFVSVYQTFEVV